MKTYISRFVPIAALVMAFNLSGCSQDFFMSKEEKEKAAQEHLQRYKQVLQNLKSVKNPEFDDNFNIVTKEDVQASANRANGSSTSYSSENSSSNSGSSSDYYSSKNVHDRQYFADEYNKTMGKAQEAYAKGDTRETRKLLENAAAQEYLYHQAGGK